MYLKPCPFCGSTTLDIHQVSLERGGARGWELYISCAVPDCSAEGPKVWVPKKPFSNEEQDRIDQLAAHKWNRRTGSAALP